MVNSLESIRQDVTTNLWATRGLETGVHEQTAEVLEIIEEVATDLPDMESIAVVPVGSRLKGYATEESDLDLAIVHYDDKPGHAYDVRIVIDEVVRERTGIEVCHDTSYVDMRDIALTISLATEHGGPLYAGHLAYLFSPAVFIGEHAEAQQQELIADLIARDAMCNPSQWPRELATVNNSFGAYFVITQTDVADRYMRLAEKEGMQLNQGQTENVVWLSQRERIAAFGSTVFDTLQGDNSNSLVTPDRLQ